MSTLLLPRGATPTNIHLREGDKARLVTGDLFHVSERIREISPNLYILELEVGSAEAKKFSFAIMEQCKDGVDRLVIRVPKTRETQLDGRILDRLRRIMAVDLHTRIAILDAEREKWEAEKHEDEIEQNWENLGGPMYVQMAHDGFFQRSESYRPMNRTARRHGRRMT